MSDRRERDYIAKHEQIKNKLMEMTRESEYPCFSVSKIATELGMDQRTIRSHLRILEVDSGGVFVDPERKEFCTIEGITQLAKRLELIIVLIVAAKHQKL